MIKWFIRGILALVLVFCIFLVLAYVYIGSIVKTGIEKISPRILGAPVHIEQLDIKALSGKIEVTKFKLDNPPDFKSEHVLQVGKISIELVPKSVLSDTVHIKEIRIEDPSFIYETKITSSNVGVIKANLEAFLKKIDTGEEKPGKKIIIDKLSITGATVRGELGPLGGLGFSRTLPDIELTDIGKESETNIADVIDDIFGEILGSITEIVSKVGGLIEEGADGIMQEIKKVPDGIMDIIPRFPR